MNNDQNLNLSKLIGVLSKMDKSELQANISKINSVLNSKDKDKIINTIKNNYNK